MHIKFKKKYLVLVMIIFCSKLNAQQNSIYFIKYEYLKSDSYEYNCWFLKDTMMYTIETVYKKMYRNFPVYDKYGNSKTETDTIKYKNEYEEFLNEIISLQKDYVNTNKRAYNSNILKRYQENKKENLKLFVVDTLLPMDNWTIKEDTITFMGFKCQKAILDYEGMEYEALFTTQLPSNAGPEKFRGLPGLILKVSNKTENFGFVAKEIIFPFKGNLPKYGLHGEIWSQKKYSAYVEELNKNSHQALEKLIENTIKGYKKEF